jgi:hypothetical protein
MAVEAVKFGNLPMDCLALAAVIEGQQCRRDFPAENFRLSPFRQTFSRSRCWCEWH